MNTQLPASQQACVELRDLRLNTNIGTYAPHDVVPDAHMLDLTLWLSPALVLIAQDGMSHVFDYDPLVAEIDRLAANGHYETQERLITRIVHACAAYREIEALNIGLCKSPVRQGSGLLGVRVSVDAHTLNTLRHIESTDVQEAMTALSGWTLDTHPQHHTSCLSKSWTLPSFEAAVSRFNQIAQLAQTQDHHPEVLSSYTQLQVRIWTHDAAGLTHKDFTLAQAIDQLSTAP
jgi:pterin-4a-carbinolamine dehydratase/dihydroneopterin aldolase